MQVLLIFRIHVEETGIPEEMEDVRSHGDKEDHSDKTKIEKMSPMHREKERKADKEKRITEISQMRIGKEDEDKRKPKKGGEVSLTFLETHQEKEKKVKSEQIIDVPPKENVPEKTDRKKTGQPKHETGDFLRVTEAAGECVDKEREEHKEEKNKQMVPYRRAEKRIKGPEEKSQIKIDIGDCIVAAKKAAVPSEKCSFPQHPEGPKRRRIKGGEIILKDDRGKDTNGKFFQPKEANGEKGYRKDKKGVLQKNGPSF